MRPLVMLLLMRIALLIGPKSAGARAMPQGEWRGPWTAKCFTKLPSVLKNVHEATLRFVQSGERHPNVAIYGLNSVRGKTFRDIRVGKGLHQMKCAIEHVNSAVRATIGGIQESACLVGCDSQARVGRTRARSISRDSGMTEARPTANRRIPTADRTV